MTGAAPGPAGTAEGTLWRPQRKANPSPPLAHEAAPLYHFTCEHMARPIIACGALVPFAHPLFPHLAPVVWLTTADQPDPQATGFRHAFLACDPMAFRFLVTDRTACVPWPVARDQAPFGATDPDAVMMLEHGCRPDTWWVSPIPVPVVLDG